MNTESKKVIITGGSGFLGDYISGWLLDRGFSVVSLDVAPPQKEEIAFVQKNMLTDDLADQRLENPYAVINLAGKNIFGRWTTEFKQAVYDTRVKGTENLVELFANERFRPEVFVSASAAGYYGDRGNEKLTADSPPGEGFLATVSQDWEYAAHAAETLGVPTTIIRNGHILGDGGLLKTLLPYYQWGIGGPLGSGEQWFPWIHINDIARIYVAALHQADNVDTMNAVSNNRVRNREFSQTLAQALSRPHIFRIPQFALRMLFGDFAEEMFYSQRVTSQAEEKLGITLQFDQLRKALHDLLDKASHN
jgi:uncharacterized protein (TIGR01777 family)